MGCFDWGRSLDQTGGSPHALTDASMYFGRKILYKSGSWWPWLRTRKQNETSALSHDDYVLHDLLERTERSAHIRTLKIHRSRLTSQTV